MVKKICSKKEFRPFRAWHYEPRRVTLGRVIAPPYDVISPEERELLYQKDPLNVVRLILGKEPDFHDRAALRWREWSRKGVLVNDSVPAYYLYQQTFQHPLTSRTLKRTAVIGTLKLEESGTVLPHEATFSGPKRDRLLLLEKTHCNLSPIFGLVPDPRKALTALGKECEEKAPLLEAGEEEGTTHRVWALQDKKNQDAIHRLVAEEKILIADGHHRYETALEYRRRKRQKLTGAPPEAPYDFVMMALVGFQDEGLLVLPTHRLLRSLAPWSDREFLERLKEHFEVRPVPADQLFQTLEDQPVREKVFGIAFRKKEGYLLRLKNLNCVKKNLSIKKPDLWYEVEANLLNHFVFDKIWGLSEEKRREKIEYTHLAGEAVQKVEEGGAEAALLLRSPQLALIQELADLGEKMPQKTTFFYPKLASGLFFYYHGD